MALSITAGLLDGRVIELSIPSDMHIVTRMRIAGEEESLRLVRGEITVSDVVSSRSPGLY
jgi:hypothetical protein